VWPLRGYSIRRVTATPNVADDKLKAISTNKRLHQRVILCFPDSCAAAVVNPEVASAADSAWLPETHARLPQTRHQHPRLALHPARFVVIAVTYASRSGNPWSCQCPYGCSQYVKIYMYVYIHPQHCPRDAPWCAFEGRCRRRCPPLAIHYRLCCASRSCMHTETHHGALVWGDGRALVTR
jgi:hypothetical protein